MHEKLHAYAECVGRFLIRVSVQDWEKVRLPNERAVPGLQRS